MKNKNDTIIIFKNTKFLIYILLIIINIFLVIKIKYFQLDKIPKISVFLPIYNKEKYLIESINSIQNQTLKDIEIIAVNDASTDKTLYILKKLAKNDKRIKIVNNDRNHGLLYSRAMGILNSTGEYLMNLDPDDKFQGNHNFEYLYNIIKKSNLDYIIFLLEKIPIKQSELKICELENRLQIEKEQSLITNKLIKKNIFLKAYKKFEKYIYSNKWNFHEDNIWHRIINILTKSKIKINKFIYLYKRNNESLMINKGNIREKMNKIYYYEMHFELENFNTMNFYKKYNKLFKDINNIYSKYILNNYEIRRRLIHILVKLLKNILNKNKMIFELINNYTNKVSNKKIIIFKEEYKSILDEYLTYISIYKFIKENNKKNIISINQNQINNINNYIYPDDIIILFNDIIFYPEIINLINKFTINKKILILTQNEDIKYNNKLNIILNNISNYKIFFFYNYTINTSNYLKLQNNIYIFPNFIYNLANFINYKKNMNKNNLLILLNKQRYNDLDNSIINKISKYFEKIYFYKYFSKKNIKKLISIINDSQILITDSIFIQELSVVSFTSCIVLIDKKELEKKKYKLVNQLDYIKIIYNINEIEKNIINLKNKNNIELNNNYFIRFKKEFI